MKIKNNHKFGFPLKGSARARNRLPASNGTRAITGGVTAPIGFTANGVYSGIKKSKKKDLAMIYSERPCAAAGVFTTNKVQASCVVINKSHIKDGRAQAIIANSGNANCMTGRQGFENSRKMTKEAAKRLELAEKDVLIASTGIIGKPLPIQNIVKAIPELASALSRSGKEAAEAILTTDKHVKEAAAEITLGGAKVKIGAIAKGAGMIHPQMKSGKHASAKGYGVARHATMLCFVTTDADISAGALQNALNQAVENTFNMITIDGDMSTNDMVLILANGMAKNKRIAGGSRDFRRFKEALEEIFLRLAKLMVEGAEGATKFVEVEVTGAASSKDARKVARSVASSNLLKCAVHGSDPNWGRIAASAGYSGARVDPWKMQIRLGSELAVQSGGPIKKDRAVFDRIFAKKKIKITVGLGLGKFGATAYTCDFSPEYVRINSAYKT